MDLSAYPFILVSFLYGIVIIFHLFVKCSLLLVIITSFNLIDIDECSSNTHNCDTNAACINTPGNFICTCNFGYTGNEQSCTGLWFLLI